MCPVLPPPPPGIGIPGKFVHGYHDRGWLVGRSESEPDIVVGGNLRLLASITVCGGDEKIVITRLPRCPPIKRRMATILKTLDSADDQLNIFGHWWRKGVCFVSIKGNALDDKLVVNATEC